MFFPTPCPAPSMSHARERLTHVPWLHQAVVVKYFPPLSPLVAEIHHALLRVSRAELSPFGAICAVRRVFVAAGLAAPLAANIHHSFFRVPGAEFSLFAPLDAVGRVLAAPGVTTSPGDHRRLPNKLYQQQMLIQDNSSRDSIPLFPRMTAETGLNFSFPRVHQGPCSVLPELASPPRVSCVRARCLLYLLPLRARALYVRTISFGEKRQLPTLNSLRRRPFLPL